MSPDHALQLLADLLLTAMLVCAPLLGSTLLAGLVVLGPERLPGVIRRVGKTYSEIRRAASGYEREFRDTFKEPLDDFRKAAKDIRSGFGDVDHEPSPPFRPEQTAFPTPDFSPSHPVEKQDDSVKSDESDK